MDSNYKEFWYLLNSGDRTKTKNELVKQFSNGRTTSLKKLDCIEYSLMLGAMQADLEKDKTDYLRKRVIKAIGMAKGIDDNITLIKSIAVKAAGKQYTDFNKIPPDRLNKIYYAFKKSG